ncbi:MAG: hypothetical protein IV105_16005 [Rhizobacter sp.]|nr:hypothetical protein [Rhizobacter sp.]
MTTNVEQPPATADTKKPPHRFQKGVSGNPKGRAPGIIDRRQKIAQVFEAAAAEIAEAVRDAARKGDMQACTLVLSRLSPPLRPRAERVHFDLDVTKPLAAQAAQVLAAVATGQLDTDSAQTVLTCLGTYAALVQADDVQARLAALERAAAGSTNGARGGVLEMEKMQ